MLKRRLAEGILINFLLNQLKIWFNLNDLINHIFNPHAPDASEEDD